MRYKIYGASRETGKDCTMELNAPDRETAIFYANQHHILVNLCEELKPQVNETAVLQSSEPIRTDLAMRKPPPQDDPVQQDIPTAPSQSKMNQNVSSWKPIAEGVWSLLVIAILIVWFIWPSGGPKSGTSNRRPDPMPTIRVIASNNESVQGLRFSNWHVVGFNVEGTMVWTGERKIESLTFTLRRADVVLRRGDVIVPGDRMVKNEPTVVALCLWEEPTADKDITIEIEY